MIWDLMFAEVRVSALPSIVCSVLRLLGRALMMVMAVILSLKVFFSLLILWMLPRRSLICLPLQGVDVGKLCVEDLVNQVY